ncbi:hypothetical protein BDQ17DRAFT_1337144 [Cyathus striatus]|nr:hypothetical protein BDQ17DRAFT_1337144 [Cyathus striatus]
MWHKSQMHTIIFALVLTSALAQKTNSSGTRENAIFRQSSFNSSQTFNPNGKTVPFIQVFDKSFSSVLGPNPIFRQVSFNASFAFAFEAPIYIPETDEIFFSTRPIFPPAPAPPISNSIAKVKLADVERALANDDGSEINVPVETLDLPGTLNMTNGGTGPFHGSLLFCTDGYLNNPPLIALVNPKSPNNVTVLLDNYFGRQFNSIDDLKLHPSGKIFFTDTIYGFTAGFRPPPLMPPQVYMFDPVTGDVQVVVGDIGIPNGVAFSPDGNIAYISDTSALGVGGQNQSRPALIYAFDVDPHSQLLSNKRAFAFPDAGIPDGIQVDSQGNVYAGCTDGVQVWNPKGKLLGKFFVGAGNVANMAFAGDGRLVVLATNALLVAKIAAKSALFTS